MLIKRITVGLGFSIFIILLLALGLKRASQSEWENWKAEWQAKGEKFDISSNIPNKVPDHQNFAKSKFFAPLYANDIETAKFNEARDRFKIKKLIKHDWRKGKQRDSISWENSFFESDLAQIAEDLKRPYCRFDIQYQDGFEAQLPHLSTIKNIAYLFSIRAGEKLIKKDTVGAMQDTLNVIQLGEQLRLEPFIISQLVRISILEMSLQTFWEGQVNDQWTAKQLILFQEKIKDIDLLKGIELALILERNITNQWFTNITQEKKGSEELADILGLNLNFAARYFLYNNQYQINKIITEDILSIIDISNHKVSANQIKIAEKKILQLKDSFIPSRYAITLMLLPNCKIMMLKISQAQTALNQAYIVAALERYRLKNNKYPKKLNKLQPDYISKIPADLFHEKDLIYQSNHDSSFTLYSRGFNEKDDNGKFFIKNKKINFDSEKGDWPWPKITKD